MTDPLVASIRRRLAEGGPTPPTSPATPAAPPPRELSPLGFYSHAAEQAQALPQEQGTPDQYKGMLTKRGVSPEEFKWSGFDKAFAGKKRVAKGDLAKHFRANMPKLQETVLANEPERWSHFSHLFSEPDQPKFGQYTLPGGKNYREHLLHLPEGQDTARRMTEIEGRLNRLQTTMQRPGVDIGPHLAEQDALRREYKTLADKSRTTDYHSSHWDVPNVLAHLRLSDREGPAVSQYAWRNKTSGNRTKLFDSEAEARQHLTTLPEKLRGNLELATAKRPQKLLHLEELQSDWAQEGRKKGFKATPEERADIERRYAADPTGTVDEYNRRINDASVPPAPFVGSTQKWVNMGLQRLLHHAAKGGYDKLVVTPGDTQADRYPEEGADPKVLTQRREGMKAFYDTILPMSLEKIARQHDPQAKVQLHSEHVRNKMDSYTGLHSLDITPKMRASILAKGHRTFEAGGAVERTARADSGDVQMAERGDREGSWQSYGTSGTRAGGDRFNPADREGDLNEEEWNKAREEEYEAGTGQNIRTTDRPHPTDPKGWRREYWRRMPRGDVPTSRSGGRVGGYAEGGAPDAPLPEEPPANTAPPSAPGGGAPQPVASQASLGRILDRVRGTQLGRMVSRYQEPKVGTAVKRLHADLKGLAKEGEPGRMWYEKSSKRILDYTQGNKDEAHKIAQLIAIYSPQTGVPTNTANAIKAYNRAKSGEAMWAGQILDPDRSFSTIKGASDYAQSLGRGVTKVPLDDSGKRFLFARHDMKGYENIATADRDLKAHLLMNHGIPFEGRKTNNFYRNLMVHIDPSIDQGSTQDLWMARAFGFHDDAVSNAFKYDFMEKLTHKLAVELGWKPHQVQAAIWTAMKTRQEAVQKSVQEEALRTGLGDMVPGEKGKPVFQIKPGQEDAHSSLTRQRALEAVLEPGHIERSARDFSDFLDANLAHASWESVPSTSVSHLKGLSDMGPEVKADYHKRISEALQDEHGNDLLAKYLGMLSPGVVEGPGYWQGQSNPTTHQQVAATRIKAAGQRPDIDTASKKLLDAYANARGLLLKQDAVGYHRPFYNPQVSRANGVEYKFDRGLKGDEIRRLGAEVEKIPGAALVPIGHDTMRVLHFPDSGNPETHVSDYRKHHAAVDAAVQRAKIEPDSERKLFASDGDLHSNDWGSSPHGEDYRSRLSAAGRSDLLEYVASTLAPKVQAVDEEFAKEHGLRRDLGLEQTLRQAHKAAVAKPTAAPAIVPPELLHRALGGRSRPPDGGFVARAFGAR